MLRHLPETTPFAAAAAAVRGGPLFHLCVRMLHRSGTVEVVRFSLLISVPHSKQATKSVFVCVANENVMCDDTPPTVNSWVYLINKSIFF